jgi:hypothetical protein
MGVHSGEIEIPNRTDVTKNVAFQYELSRGEQEALIHASNVSPTRPPHDYDLEAVVEKAIQEWFSNRVDHVIDVGEIQAQKLADGETVLVGGGVDDKILLRNRHRTRGSHDVDE